MNNIKELRQERLLSQKELVAAVNLPGFDVPLLSKIENDVCRPTPEAEIRLCKALHAQPVELYGEWRHITLNESFPPVAPPELDFEIVELLQYLPRSKANAIPRQLLAINMDVSDRKLRKIIEKANAAGVIVANGSDGRGYYLVETVEEGAAYYRQEHRRAISKLVALEPLRKWLIEKGYAL